MPVFAANLSMMFTEWDFLDRFQAARDAGFEAVEFMFPYDHDADAVAAALSRARLSLALFNVYPGDFAAGDRGLAALPARSGEFAAALDRTAHYAAALGTPRLHLMAGLASPADPAAAAAYRDALARAADRFGPDGIDVLIEPINPRDMPGYFLADFGLAETLIHDLARPNLKLQFDIYHRQIIAGDVTRALEALLPITGHIQVASVPARHEPGTGELADDRLFETIDALGWRGLVGCEYRPRAGTLEGLGWFDRWRRT